jgi:hypothetical protein
MRRSTVSSFSACIATANRRKDYPVISAMFDKERSHRLLEALGAPLPRDFRVIGELSRLTPDHLVEPTVLKPARSYNNRGVVALVPLGGHRWFEQITATELTFAELTARLDAEREKAGFADRWIGEELLRAADGSDRPVDDVKISMFGDYMACSFVRSTRPRGFQWFDDVWEKVNVGIHTEKLDPTLNAPENAEQLLGIARAIGAALPLPYIRVDLYPTDRGPVVGELTPLPGWYFNFNDEWDERMGRLYEERERYLFSRGMDWSRVTPPDIHTILADLGLT